jgi:uncharacterized protein YjbI with pentapeptide repeats
MVGRLLRVTGTVLVIAVAFVTPVLATSTPASADTVVNGCTIVANPTATNFTDCPGANLSGTDLSGDDLSFANLAGANLSNSGLAVCFLTSEFSGACQSANLTDANLTAAVLPEASLVDCSILPPLRVLACGAVDLAGANLTDANLSGTSSILPELFLSECQRLGCELNFTGAILTGANLTGTPLLPSVQGSTSATSSAGAVVTFRGPPFVPGAFVSSCTPPSGSTFPIGTTTVTCQVLDDFGDVATGTFTVTVTQVPTVAAVLSSSPTSPSRVGQPVTYSGFVFSLPNPGAPPATGGTLAFTDNGSPIPGCTAVPISGTSTPSTAAATCTTTPDTTGAHTITVQYSGSGIFAPGSNTVPFVHVVTKVPCQALAGCNLSGLDLSNTSFEVGDFHGANLQGANLSGDALFEANFEGANLSGANLTGASLQESDFTGANLHDANLTGVFDDATSEFPASVNLSNANLSGANLTGAYLGEATFTGANVTGATWSNTTCADFTNSDDDGGTCVGHL